VKRYGSAQSTLAKKPALWALAPRKIWIEEGYENQNDTCAVYGTVIDSAAYMTIENKLALKFKNKVRSQSAASLDVPVRENK
jgi:hypothetical protein